MQRVIGAVIVSAMTVVNAVSAEPPKDFTNSIGMAFKLIPAGEFMMGAPDSDPLARNYERPQHKVTIAQPLHIAVTEVTQRQYEAVRSRRASEMVDNPSTDRGDNHPVESIRWNDAVLFCNILSELEGRKPCYRINGTAVSIVAGNGYRLPFEAEWEYACRAGTTTPWCCGDDEASLKDYAWCAPNSGSTTHPVAKKKANAWGLHDMHGNVEEWCNDWAGYYPGAPDRDSGEPLTYSKVYRGGSWFDVPKHCRAATRFGLRPLDRRSFLGFRVVLVAPE